jgi:hypothetical protein
MLGSRQSLPAVDKASLAEARRSRAKASRRRSAFAPSGSYGETAFVCRILADARQ